MVAALNEHVIQPHVKPLVEKAVNQVNKVTTWVDEKIYQPVFAPVVNDINKYIVQPLAEKASDTWAKYGEWVHGSLDAAGFIPGLGDIADGLNGLIYLAEGRYVEATVSALSMIPVVGDVVGKGGKWAVKLGAAAAGGVLGAAAAKTVKEFIEKMVRKFGKNVGEDVAEGLTKAVTEEVAEQTGQEAAEKVAKEVREMIDDNLTKFMDTRVPTTDINCYGCALKEWPEYNGLNPYVKDLHPNPWKGDYGDPRVDYEVGARNKEDQILDALINNFSEVDDISALNRGDIISWHASDEMIFQDIINGKIVKSSSLVYDYTTHVGIYTGNNNVFSKVGRKGPYAELAITNPDLIKYGDMRFWIKR